jgi:hypothetical protein
VAIAGVAIAWVSGVLLEAARARRGALGAPRLVLHALFAVAAVGGAAYLAVDRGRLIDLVAETWEHGPQAR